uniref:Uncharacterized protein n=1 Tax=Candidatus Kentrum sp. SD TaxID=2126332 RepID=A0A450YCF7_9GAMM|nr:MAG: hypothetical protein BECKSD772F_GA0070984_100255 [Candidatus Kentron sp. SD]VFK39231.1 MAG: hypothetical protein BECKSD772E_GA0070983_100253 [Candidatus Kentron sp. SD]
MLCSSVGCIGKYSAPGYDECSGCLVARCPLAIQSASKGVKRLRRLPRHQRHRFYWTLRMDRRTTPQAYGMAHLGENPIPMVSATARFHGNDAGRQIRHERRDFFLDNCFLTVISVLFYTMEVVSAVWLYRFPSTFTSLFLIRLFMISPLRLDVQNAHHGLFEAVWGGGGPLILARLRLRPMNHNPAVVKDR